MRDPRKSDLIAELEAAFEKTTQGEWRNEDLTVYADIGIQPHVLTALIKEADGTFAATAHNHWPALMDVVEKARKVAEFGWGTGATEAQHFERMAAMDEMRRSLEGLK